MVTQTFDISDYSLVGGRQPRSRRRREDDRLSYRLEVVGASVADVVEAAGGWLFDRLMAGWKVSLLLTGGPDVGQIADVRPLRVLGVHAADLQMAPADADTASASQTLAVSSAAFSADPLVRDRVLNALDGRCTEVALWGDGWPLGIDRAMTRTPYTLSAAARVFKGHALEAAGMRCDSVDSVEMLLTDVARLG